MSEDLRKWPNHSEAKRAAVAEFESRYIKELLRKNHCLAAAARAAGLDRSNFRRLMKRYQVSRRAP